MHRVRWAQYPRLSFRGFLIASVLLCTVQVALGQKPDKGDDDGIGLLYCHAGREAQYHQGKCCLHHLTHRSSIQERTRHVG